MAEWFEEWFGETYLEMYPHRDENDAAAAVELISNVAKLKSGRVLDLASGPGRHSNVLRNHARQVVGVDLSAPLLRRARQDYSPPLSVVRGDMRFLPLAASSFDLVVNLFTSFGFFETDDQHGAVLGEVARVLCRSGWFVLDYLNASRVRDDLVEREHLTLGGRQVAVERRISADGRFVLKDMKLIDEGRGFQERVRLFSPEELENLLAAAGFSVRDRFGSYQGETLTADSPRALLFSVCQ